MSLNLLLYLWAQTLTHVREARPRRTFTRIVRYYTFLNYSVLFLMTKCVSFILPYSFNYLTDKVKFLTVIYLL